MKMSEAGISSFWDSRSLLLEYVSNQVEPSAWESLQAIRPLQAPHLTD